ncbi:MAG: DUF2188 domain-containing protein [Rhodothermaceae bacterium]|nr:DUF2188 domain-containing protein [Rhodothermaceae bacterium]
MPSASVYHVVPRDGEWAVKLEGAERASRVTPERDDAVDAASGFVRSLGAGRVVVHRDDGTIETVHTYDSLPAPIESGRDWLDVVLSKPALALAGGVFLIAIGYSLRDRF